MILILLIICCSLIGTAVLIGLSTPIFVAPTTPPKDNKTSNVIEEMFQGSGNSNDNHCGEITIERDSEGNKKTDLRRWIASRSIQILRSRGMSDEEIKLELLRDFSLTEEEVDDILAAQ